MHRLVFTLLLVVASTALAAGISFPPLTGRVVDQAGILSPGAEQNLTAELQVHEKATGQQVVVATVTSLEERDIAEYGVELGRAWGIGQKDKNTGAILLVAPNERAVRIEVGYGLEGTLTDAGSRLIIENIILPEFRAGNMEAGIVAGVAAMLTLLRGDPDALPQYSQDPGEIPPILVALVIVFLMLKFSGKIGKLDYWHAQSGRRRGGFGGGFGGRSGGGGGGFSGGGGSFGGGGASGRW